MQTQRRRRIYFLVFLLTGIASSAALALFALRNNINLYYSPSEVYQKHLAPNQTFRLGGNVALHSVQHNSNKLQIFFFLTDAHKKIPVEYCGILPSLFREGQGIVAEGHMSAKGIFMASQVLAKHDATYKPNV